jgi:hypothetical protein
MNDDLPFRRVDGYPSTVNGSGVMARLLDALGFRFYWATEGLTEEHYAFSPGSGCRTIGELVQHVWGLTNWVYVSVYGQSEGRPEAVPNLRAHVLRMIERLRAHFGAIDDAGLGAISIDGLPFWHMINGPLADALTHVGQISSFRRLAGLPAKRSHPFTCTPPDDTL